MAPDEPEETELADTADPLDYEILFEEGEVKLKCLGCDMELVSNEAPAKPDVRVHSGQVVTFRNPRTKFGQVFSFRHNCEEGTFEIDSRWRDARGFTHDELKSEFN